MDPAVTPAATDWSVLASVWGPRILAALAILVVAYIAGRALKWGLAKGLNRVPAFAHHNEGRPPKESVGAQLGELGFWLVLLIGLVAALSVLQLTGVVAPLNAMLLNVMSFIPNVIGAAVIFFVGLLLANIARKVVETALSAARVDTWLAKAGLGRLTGASGLARTAATLVFVLILIPTAIAALQQLGIRAISDPAVAVLSTVFNALPKLIAAAVILAIAFLIGRWVAGVIEQVLASLGFDRSVGALGVGPARTDGAAADPGHVTAASVSPNPELSVKAPPLSGFTPSKAVGQIALWAIMLFSAVEAARLLEFAAVANILVQIVELGGHVLFGGVIIAAGVIIADILARLIDRSTAGADRFASTIVRWATISLATAMGLRFMGIADEIVILAFALILGAAAVAAALAFGLGGRDAAGRLASKWADKAETLPRPRPAAAPVRDEPASEPRTIPPSAERPVQ